MKKLLIGALQLLLVAGTILFLAPPIQAQQAQDKQILFFYGQGCSHCARVEEYFNSINAFEEYPIVKKEIYFSRVNAAEFNDILENNGVPIGDRGVPATVMGNTVTIGDTPIIDGFISSANEYLGRTINPGQSSEDPNPGKESQNNNEDKTGVSMWLIISAAIVDAVNPCAFAVLLILLTTVLAQKSSRKKVITSGFAFTLAIFISYMLMGLGVYTALANAGTTSTITLVVGILAIILGLFNLKDWLWYGKTAPIEVPMSWRPKMASIIRHVTSPAGAIVAGLVVSLFLLPCTSGPYIVVLGLLAENPGDLGLLTNLVIYNLVFVLPMIIITLAVAYGLNIDTVSRLREQHIDKLHMIGGFILIALGIFVLVTM